MGQVQTRPPRVLAIFAAFSAFSELLDEVPGLLGKEFGTIGLSSDRFDFTETDYYAQEMGSPLFKQFHCLADLQPADFLASAKARSNELEAKIAATKRYPVARPLNLDPGFIDGGKLALASTKGPGHRFYLGQGIFVESTLSFQRNQWIAWPWTYPDFRRADYHQFLNRARAWFLDKRRSEPT